MKQYLRVYYKLLTINFSALTSYRGNFIGSMVGSISWSIFSIIFIVLLSSRTSSVYGWSKGDLYILTGLYNILIGIFSFLFAHNFEQFASIIHYGRLDSLLIKPVDSQFFLTNYFIHYPALFRIFLGVAFTIYIISSYHIVILPFDVLLLFLLMICSVIIVYALWFMAMTLTVWNSTLSNLVGFMYTISGVARYPQEMFQGAREVFFLLFLPFTYVVNVPAKALLHRVSIGDIIVLLLLTVGLMVASRLFWRFALRSYTSASS